MGRTKGDFENRFRIIRGKATQKEFAQKMGVTLRAWQRYEYGRMPTARIIIRIADKCKVTTDWLLGMVRSELKN